jgi:DNA (cytosine-5)-methyltransferase 1
MTESRVEEFVQKHRKPKVGININKPNFKTVMVALPNMANGEILRLGERFGLKFQKRPKRALLLTKIEEYMNNNFPPDSDSDEDMDDHKKPKIKRIRKKAKPDTLEDSDSDEEIDDIKEEAAKSDKKTKQKAKVAIDSDSDEDPDDLLQNIKVLSLDRKATPGKMQGLSLFACSGIAEYYMENTKVEIAVANELLKERCAIYSHFYPNSVMIQGDIEKKFAEIVSECKKQDVEFIMATPPCQSFSNAGKKNIKDKRTPLFLTLIKVIKEVKPKYVLIENVPTFMKSKYLVDGTETVSERFKKDLADDYIIKTQILNTKNYGVPQARKRSITLLSLKSAAEWKHPEALESAEITVFDAIGHLPSLESGETSEVHKWHKARSHNDNHILWMKNTPTGKTAFKNKVHFPKTKGKDGKTRRIKGYATTYKRIEWDSPSPTITMSSGSISSQNNVHPGTIIEGTSTYDNARAMTVYEIMLLTGLDDEWDPPTDNEKIVRDIIGEAVPPILVYHLISNIP